MRFATALRFSVVLLALVITAPFLVTPAAAQSGQKPATRKPAPSVASKAPVKAPPRRHVNQLGGPKYKHGIMSPYGDWFLVLKPKSGQFGPQETFTVTGTLAREDGKPVADMTVWFFKLGKDDGKPDVKESWEADLYLGAEEGKLTFINPKAKSDAEGRFTITLGPAWKEVRRAIVGLVISASKDKPFDVHVLPILEEGKILELTPTAEQPRVDLGKIVVEAKMPMPEAK